MNLTVTRATAALEDPRAVESLLAVVPVPHFVSAHLANARDQARQVAQYDPASETLHYFAGDGTRMVRLSVAGIPLQRAAGAILATHDVLNASARAVGVKLEKLLVLPVHVHARAEAAPPSKHPEVRETLRIVPVARVPML